MYSAKRVSDKLLKRRYQVLDPSQQFGTAVKVFSRLSFVFPLLAVVKGVVVGKVSCSNIKVFGTSLVTLARLATLATLVVRKRFESLQAN